MRYELLMDDRVVGAFTVDGRELSDAEGMATMLIGRGIRGGGIKNGLLYETERPPESNEEMLMFVADWARLHAMKIREVGTVETKGLRKVGTSEGACLREQRLGHKLRSCVGADFVKGLIRDRAKIGHPKHNVRLGKIGEQITAQLMTKYQAHEKWSDAHDLSDDKLIEVKTIRGDSTPIMPHSKELKLAAMDSSGKDMSMILLKVEEDRIRVFEHQFSDSFRSGGKDAVYVVSINDSTELGYLDENGDFQEMEA